MKIDLGHTSQTRLASGTQQWITGVGCCYELLLLFSSVVCVLVSLSHCCSGQQLHG
jgi:hypothetical protein